MLLKWIELENIRSYVKERIEFPLGTTLLSGDVGCGKSSVLLAVEFALFGIQRGELAGGNLLRHGKPEGSVKLCFEVGGKEVVIFRSLERDKKGVSQGSGWIQISGIRQSKTASELRAMVLELLGYPTEYQTKNPIVFRYTVYTPQDEMKRILFADANERLGILRKIFQIDKYGRIRANAEAIVVRELRAMKRELESLSSDLEQRTIDCETMRGQLEALGKERAQQQVAAEAAAKELCIKSAAVERLSEQIRSLSRVAQAAAMKESMARERKARNQRIANEISELEKRIVSIEKSLGAKPPAPTETEQELAAKRRELEARRSEVISRRSLLESEIRRYKIILEKGRCEFCGQSVAGAHGFAERVSEREQEFARILSEAERIATELSAIERKQAEFRDYSYKLKLYEAGERELREKQAKLRELSDEHERNERDIAAAEEELSRLRTELSKLVGLEAEERKAKAELGKAQLKKTEADKALARTESQIESMTRELGRLEKEIADKRAMRLRIAELSATASWLEQTFIPLMQLMEQTVMATIQQEFNSVFQLWFGILMGSENLSVEVDDQFAPVIMQEGYQTEYQNLSGGEKTAVALAYRLALNKAINTLIESIRTKDLIIL
ncbi:MAG: SMC family ATPase, partial [Candidatus Aenigmatarchaeota archaeon]